MSEQEKRMHRCCFSGHRPEKLRAVTGKVQKWLDEQIEQAISDGYVTFISGMGMGVDIWAGELVLKKKEKYPQLHLIAAAPYPTCASRWNDEWKARYKALWESADLRVEICPAFDNDAFRKRNEWMVNHSMRLIAYYSGDAGGTKDTIAYAVSQGLETVVRAESDAWKDI